MVETLTVLRLGVAPTLARTLHSTNSIKSMISIARAHSRNLPNWQNGIMALRRLADGMVEAGKQLSRVNGSLHLPALRNGPRPACRHRKANATSQTERAHSLIQGCR